MNTRWLPVLPCLLAFIFPAAAADWPQWRGPERAEISHDTGLRESWPKDGPPLVWPYRKAGFGYSGPAVVGTRLFLLGSDDKMEFVSAIDTRTGKQLWSTAIGPCFKHERGDGPRSTPTVDGELLFALGGQGELVCIETATGKMRWGVNLKNDLGGEMMSHWGYSESPLVDGGQVVCSPGGPRGALAALDKKTGKVIWRSEELKDKATYSSIIVAEVGGVRQYIQTVSARDQEGAVVGVAAKDGRLLWRYRRDGYRTAVVPTPIFHDNYVYVTAGYGAGCDLIKLTPSKGGIKVERVYANKVMVNHHGGVVLLDGYVYGYSDGKGWVCQDFKTGKSVWEEKGKFGKGSLTYADGHLYCYSEKDGTAVLIAATPAGWKESGRFRIPQHTTPKPKIKGDAPNVWTHPVVANGKLYLRDQDLLFCYDVKNPGVSSR
jgi:outer membrane protein assembly factor BamB